MKKNCVCIIDLNDYLSNYSNWDRIFTAFNSDKKSDVFIATQNEELLYKSTLWNYLENHRLINSIKIIELDVSDISDVYLKKMTLCSLCENIRVVSQSENNESYNFYINIYTKVSILTRPFQLNKFLNCPEKLVIQYQDIFHNRNQIISGIDLFCSNHSTIFSYLQNVIYYAKSTCIIENEIMTAKAWDLILKNDINYGWKSGINNDTSIQKINDEMMQVFYSNVAMLHLAIPVFIF
jgi:hypothetical protein